MGRYSLNLRPIYGADEQNPGDQFASGISAAIRQHMQEGQEDSARRAQGQVLTKETGIADRIGGVVRKVRGVFGPEGGAGPALQPTGTFAAPPAQTPSLPGTPLGISARPNAFAGMLPSITSEAAQGPITPAASGNAAAMTPALPAPAQHALAASRPSIGAAIQPYEDHDTHGNTWAVDPLYQAKLADQGKGVGDEAKIAALTAAGMPEAEARARVLNNVVRYDETFGEGPRGGRGSSLTFEQRKKLQDDAIASRQKIADMTRSGRQNTEEYRQEMLKLRRHEADLREQGMQAREDRANISADVSIGNAIDHAIPKDPIATATATDQQRADWQKKGAQRDAHLKSASDALSHRKNATASREQVAARAQQLQKQGMSRGQIAAQLRQEGYRVQ